MDEVLSIIGGTPPPPPQKNQEFDLEPFSPRLKADIHHPRATLHRTHFSTSATFRGLEKSWVTRLLAVNLAAVAEIQYGGFVHRPNVLIILILNFKHNAHVRKLDLATDKTKKAK